MSAQNFGYAATFALASDYATYNAPYNSITPSITSHPQNPQTPISASMCYSARPYYNPQEDIHHKNVRRGPSKQLLYCEICKISCSCARAYNEHIESKKHKKREATAKQQPVGSTSNNKFQCELCDISCTDIDAYASHVRGIKHQKVVKLHTKLGKPIPKDDPIKFTKSDNDNDKKDDLNKVGWSENVENTEERNVKPVGSEYIEEINENGKLVLFNCKLCDCKFSDPNAKEMHMKGRRHRLQYKRKVEPDLVVDVKPTARQKRMASLQVDLWAGLRKARAVTGAVRRETLLTETLVGDRFAAPQFADLLPNMRPEGINDFYAIMRHSEIYPTKKMLNSIHEIVSSTEFAVRSLSDNLANDVNSLKTVDSAGTSTEANTSGITTFKSNTFKCKERVLQCVMRVGLLAKGLLLQGDNLIHLVVLCTEKPTLELLECVASGLTMQFKQLLEDTGNNIKTVYHVSVNQMAGCVVVTDDEIELRVSLTSPLCRDYNNSFEKTEKFPYGAALKSLAELRHTKWFEAKAAPMPSCVLTIRLMRDLCRRYEVWRPLDHWALQLLVERIMTTARFPLGLSDSLRRIMEAISSGILLHGVGLLDPCEKEPCDVLNLLSIQQREDITRHAQFLLRCIAFKQMYRVLGVEQMSTSKLKWKFWLSTRKRSCDNDNGENKYLSDGKVKKI